MSSWIHLFLLLYRQVVCSRSAARSAGFAESPFVLLTDPSIRAKQQPVRATIFDRRTADLPAPRAVAVSVGPQVAVIWDLVVTGLLPSVRVASHFEEGCLLHSSGYFVLLCGHVLWVLLVGQTVVGEREGQEVWGTHHTLAEVWRWGRCRWRRQRELSGQRGINRSGSLPYEVMPATNSFSQLTYMIQSHHKELHSEAILKQPFTVIGKKCLPPGLVFCSVQTSSSWGRFIVLKYDSSHCSQTN